MTGTTVRQMTLDEAPVAVPYQAHSATSREAAEHMKTTGRAASLTTRALLLFLQNAAGGLTDEELDDAGRRAGLAFSTLRPRRVALCTKGYVHPLKERRTTRSGLAARVWGLTVPGYVEARAKANAS